MRRGVLGIVVAAAFAAGVVPGPAMAGAADGEAGLAGRWVAVDDPETGLEFREGTVTMFMEGMEPTEEDVYRVRRADRFELDDGTVVEGNLLVLSNEFDTLVYTILEQAPEKLVLSALPRGNTLVYRRVAGGEAARSLDGILEGIRERLAAIDAPGRTDRVVTVDLEGSAEGGELEAFYDGNRPVRLVATYYGETGRIVKEYDIGDDGTLFFASTREERYDRPITAPGEPTVVERVENRYFLDGGEIVSWLDTEGNRVPGNQYASMAHELHEELAALLAKLP